MSILSDVIITSMKKHPEDWQVGECLAFNDKANLTIWIANLPVIDTNTYPSPCLNWLEKWKVWKAIKELKRTKVLLSLMESESNKFAEGECKDA